MNSQHLQQHLRAIKIQSATDKDISIHDKVLWQINQVVKFKLHSYIPETETKNDE